MSESHYISVISILSFNIYIYINLRLFNIIQKYSYDLKLCEYIPTCNTLSNPFILQHYQCTIKFIAKFNSTILYSRKNEREREKT